MRQTTFELLDNDEREEPLKALDREQKQRLIELMAQAIATVMGHAQGGHDEQS